MSLIRVRALGIGVSLGSMRVTYMVNGCYSVERFQVLGLSAFQLQELGV